jgi:pimeloyl-ACP methyl ester carboxylesterase
MLRHCQQDAPEWSPESAWRYGFKQCAADIKELARQLGSSQIILGGHDW